MTQGATPSLQDRPAALIGPPQQSLPPPGLAPHPTPPHVPQVVGQQTSCLIRPRAHVGSEPKEVGAGVGAGEMIQGASSSSQEISLAKIGPPQQLLDPPGNPPQPVPPHVPHVEGQQRFCPTELVPIIPRSQVGSGVPGTGVIIHGAEVSSQDNPEFRIGVPQQLPEPPGRLPHPVPPQAPQEAAQQRLLPEALFPIIPSSHSGSGGGGGGMYEQSQ